MPTRHTRTSGEELSPNNIFIPGGPGTDDSTCSTPCKTCQSPLTTLDTALIDATANFDSTGYPTAMLWQNQNQLYRQLLAHPNLLDSLAAADSFFTAIRVSPMGQLATVDSILYRGAILDSAAAAARMAQLNTIDSLTQLLPAIDSVLADSLSAESKDSAALAEYEQNIYSAIMYLDTTPGSAITAWYAQMDTAAIAAAALNATISPGNTIESNAVLYNQIYLSTVAVDSVAFDSTRVAQLLYIAGQCPVTGGDAVFKARALLMLVLDTTFNDDSLCAAVPDGDRMLWLGTPPASDTSTARNDTLPQKLQVKMYPNPTKDYTILKLSADVAPLQLTIIDGIGSTLVNQPIATSNGYYTINTAAFSSGLYYVALYTDTGKVFGDKLNIIGK